MLLEVFPDELHGRGQMVSNGMGRQVQDLGNLSVTHVLVIAELEDFFTLGGKLIDGFLH